MIASIDERLYGLFCLVACILLFPPAAAARWPGYPCLAGGDNASPERSLRLGIDPLKRDDRLATLRMRGNDGLDCGQRPRVLLSPRQGLKVEKAEGTSGNEEAHANPGGQPVRGLESDPGRESPGALPVGWLPSGHLFSPLLGDPRWPHFSASYHYYINGEDARQVGAISLGEVFSLYRLQGPHDGQSELGVQAGVFAIFDLEAESHDLINADYWVALHGAYRRRDISAIGRIYHRSSHLGDEFLLRGRVDRIDLSLEGVDLKLSYDLPHGFRLYGGGGFIFNQKDTDIKPWSTQAGLEFRSPWTAWGGHIRPVGALDMKNHEENGWRTDLSVRAGIQFESIVVLERNLQLLLHYYNGYSPDGQFYRQKTQYLGLGIHLYF